MCREQSGSLGSDACVTVELKPAGLFGDAVREPQQPLLSLLRQKCGTKQWRAQAAVHIDTRY